MKHLKTYEGWNPFKKEVIKLESVDLLMIELDVQILNHEIFERDVLQREVGQLTRLERMSYLRRIKLYDFIVKDGDYWKLDFKKMLEHPRIKGFWSKAELLRQYMKRYNDEKDRTDFDLTGEVDVGGGDRYLHLIDIHRMLGIEETAKIYKELNT